jgi:glycerol uptake facilitator-like aquaporin
MLRFIIPKIPLRDLPPMILVSLVGAIVAGVYGILHDQITYTLSPEYFTKLKFHQFDYADFGFSERVFAAEIGFLATWWVGLFAAWFLARRVFPDQPRARAYRQMALGFAIVIATALCAGCLGYVIGVCRTPVAPDSAWDLVFKSLKIENRHAFIRVAYIHNGSYIGGLLGLLLALRISKRGKSTENDADRSGI